MYYDGPKFESNGKKFHELPLSGAHVIRCDGKGRVVITYWDGTVREFKELPIQRP